jgi:GNAT superfamily N-acetyltransferase
MRYTQVRLTGYYPGVAGKVTELHAVYYHENWGFDITFETQVGGELCEFLSELREGRDCFRAAVIDGEFAGAIAIDGRAEDAARVRWFIVDPRFHNRGVGGALLEEAIRFCDEVGHAKVFLYTFEGLDQARRLYERHGFVLTEESSITKWGRTIREQKFELHPAS